MEVTSIEVLDDVERKAGRTVPADYSDVRFTIDRTDYEIDLSDENRQRLLAILAPYIDAGRRLTGRGTRATTPTRVVRGQSNSLTQNAPLQPYQVDEGAPPSNNGHPHFATEQDANKAIREWGRQQNLTVAPRGAISRDIRRMYAEANGDPIIDPTGKV